MLFLPKRVHSRQGEVLEVCIAFDAGAVGDVIAPHFVLGRDSGDPLLRSAERCVVAIPVASPDDGCSMIPTSLGALKPVVHESRQQQAANATFGSTTYRRSVRHDPPLTTYGRTLIRDKSSYGIKLDTKSSINFFSVLRA